MAIEYFYIDDDPIATITEIAKGLSIHPQRLKVIPHQHRKWEDEIEFIIENQTKFDGLLLDWSLNKKNESGDEANYDVEALAQQIRRLIIDKKKLKKDFPIVLCSANYKFRQIFTKELSSHDLFDGIYEKDDFNDNQEDIIGELIGLAKGYKRIIKYNDHQAPLRSCLSILGLKEKDELDYRIYEHLSNLIKEKKPPHELARFIMTKIVNTNGILVDEYLLASRIGVNILNNNELGDWRKFLNKIKRFRYSGSFSSHWEKWWMSKILYWWEQAFNNSLGDLDASQRVELLNKKYKLNLTPSKKTKKSNSNYFWFICRKTKRPIAVDDAIIASSNINKASWDEDEYYSIDEALNVNPKQVHPLERERLKKLKRIHAKTRKK